MSEKANKIWKITVKVLWGVVWTLLGIVALLVLWLAFDKFILKTPVPSVFGYSSLNIATGSMNGNSALVAGGKPKQVKEGDLIIIKDTGDYQIGDVITFLLDGEKVPTTHRIVGKTDEGFLTKGDANNSKDIVPVPEENVLGEVVAHLPTLGQFTMWLKQEGWIYVVSLLAILALGGFLIKFIDEPQTESETAEGGNDNGGDNTNENETSASQNATANEVDTATKK